MVDAPMAGLGLAHSEQSDFRQATLPRLLDHLAERLPHRPALTDAHRSLSFGDLRLEARRLARSLYVDGARPGDVVGVLIGNVNEWVVACFATQYIGATMVAINTWYTTRELSYVLTHAEVSVLIMTGSFLRYDYLAMLKELEPWSANLPNLRRVVVLGDAGFSDTMSYADFCQKADGVSESVIDGIIDGVAEKDLAFLLYTSGSTAKPKGVRLLHWGLINNCFAIGERQHLTHADTLLVPISLFWGFGCSNALFAAFTHGVHIVLQEHFSALETLDLAEKHSCTAIYLTPNMAQAVLKEVEAGRGTSRLHKGLVWGPPALMQTIFETLGADMCQSFGTTEGYGNTTITDVRDPIDKRLATSGRVLPGTEIRIVDPVTSDILAANQVGEIRIRGFIMDGYHRAPDLTADAFDGAGFFRTGDLGCLDENGFLMFRGRLKEIIRTGGMNVSPPEVEEVLRSDPAIMDVYVVGLPDAQREEIVAAVVILHEGSEADTSALTELCRRNLAAYKVPKRFCFVTPDQIPMTATRKIHRMRLGELFSPKSSSAT